MLKNKLKTLTPKKLRRWLLLFFFTLLIPTGLLVQQSYSRLKWETFHQHQQMAQALTSRIDNRLIELINKEDQRPFTDYSFLNIAGDVKANFLQRSPLSNYPVASDIPGLLGYFQVDDVGALNTPFVPEGSAERYGISTQELSERVALQEDITSILLVNKLVTKSAQTLADVQSEAMEITAKAMPSNLDKLAYQPQIVFERLTKDRASTSRKAAPIQNEEMALDEASSIQAEVVQMHAEQQMSKSFKSLGAQKQVAQARSESIVLPEVATESQESYGFSFSSGAISDIAETQLIETPAKKLRVRTFESEIDPFEFSQLDSGHFVLFRKVWLNEKRYVQGLLIEQAAFIKSLIQKPFSMTALSTMSQQILAYQGNVLTENTTVTGERLYQAKLSAPFGQLQLVYRIQQLPIGAGGRVVLWLGLILAGVLLGGFYLMYRLGLGQIKLANLQQDFVSAVSHELKTPLTSIRMYGEMLREGWAPESKKSQYYDFIFDESERLSRLINNVLQLARMTRNSQQATLATHDVTDIMSSLKPKMISQVDRAGFKLTVLIEESVKTKSVEIDMDWLTQVMINLMDNAVKFSDNAERKEVVFSCTETGNQRVAFSVRDFGPGIKKDQMKQIFDLFYRTENELTRETTGTGIGLSLVQQMVNSMDGKVGLENMEPGVTFTVSFAVVQQ